MAPSFKIGAALLAVAGVAKAGWDAGSRHNVVVYWGQGSNQANLVETCKNADIDVINIAFLTGFPDNSPGGYPVSNFGNQCWGAPYYYTSPSGVVTGLNSECPHIGPDIITCQQTYGKTIMLSLGGAYPGDYYLADDNSATNFADFLWAAYGPVQSGYTGPRPFGDAVVDGFDFDIESNISPPPNDSAGNPITDYKSRGYATMINRLRENYNTAPHPFYISGAPQCIYPDSWLDDAIERSLFDWLFIQFYNTAQCSARSYLNGQGGFNPGTWNSLTTANENVKLLLGLPAAAEAANPGYYLTQAEAYTVIGRSQLYARFAGVGLWEATYSAGNTLCNKDYASWMKASLVATSNRMSFSDMKNSICGSTVSSSSVAPSSSIVSSSSQAVSSSSVVSSSSQAVSSSSVVSSSSQAVSSSSGVSSSSQAVSSSSVVSSSSQAISSSSVASSSLSIISSSTSSSAPVSAASPSQSASSVSASCLSKPASHSKSRTRAHHSIRRCTSDCSSSFVPTGTASKSTKATLSSVASSISASCLSKPASHSKSRTRAHHSIQRCTSDCSTGTAPTSTPSKSAEITSSLASSVSAACKSKASHSKSRTRASHSIRRCTSDCFSSHVATSTGSESAPIVTYPSSATVTSTATISDTTCTGKTTVITSSGKVTTIVITSSIPVQYSSSAPAVSSSSIPENSIPYYSYSVPVYSGSSAIISSSASVVTSTSASTVSSPTATGISSLPPYYGQSSVTASVSSASAVSSLPPYHGESSVVVSTTVIVSTSTVSGGSTHVVVSSTATVTGTVPGYDHASSSTKAVTSSSPTVPVYGQSSLAAVSSSAVYPGGYPGASWSSEGYSASWTTLPGGYQGASSSVLPAKSSSSAPAVQTIYVIPVDHTIPPAVSTGSPASTTTSKPLAYTGSATTSKPAQYTGAAVKSTVGTSLMAVVIVGAYLLL